MDLAELRQRAQEGKPLYGESNQPLWVQGAAHQNSAFSQLKMRAYSAYDMSVFMRTHPNPLQMRFLGKTLNISQNSFANTFRRFNLVNHPHHGTDPSKYGVEVKKDDS